MKIEDLDKKVREWYELVKNDPNLKPAPIETIRVFPIHPLLLDYHQTSVWGPVEITDNQHNDEGLLDHLGLSLEEFLKIRGFTLECPLNEEYQEKLASKGLHEYQSLRARLLGIDGITEDQIIHYDWAATVEELKKHGVIKSPERPYDLIKLAVAEQRYNVVRRTLMRAIENPNHPLISYRKDDKEHIVSEAVVARNWTARPSR